LNHARTFCVVSANHKKMSHEIKSLKMFVLSGRED
jgi:hypothetical protein